MGTEAPHPDSEGALGNVFDAVDTGGDGTRGEDLRTRVRVPRWSLGHPDGYRVPLKTWVDGAQRVVQPGDEDGVSVHLADGFPEGGTLRLRGQGGVSPDGGPAGDLFLIVKLTDEPEPPEARARREAALARRPDASVARNEGPDLFMWILLIAFAGSIVAFLFGF